MAETQAKAPRAITLTILEDESAVLEIEGQKPVALSPQEVDVLRVLLSRPGVKSAEGVRHG